MVGARFYGLSDDLWGYMLEDLFKFKFFTKIP